MSERQRGLGRGLSALLGEAAAETPVGDAPDAVAARSVLGAQDVPIELIRRNPDQPRKHFAEEDVAELAASIREKGVLQPILVRPLSEHPGEYQIVAGERRWRAAQRAGLRSVPVLVRELDDLAVLEIGIIENVQRADLNALEEAQAYQALMDRFGRTQDAVAQVVGKSRSHVANTMRLLALPDGARAQLMSGQLSAGHARALLGAPDPDALAERVVRDGLSVRQTEALARDVSGRTKREVARTPRPSEGKSADTQALEQDLTDVLGLKVSLDDRGGAGQLSISYTSLEQLDDLCRRLMRH